MLETVVCFSPLIVNSSLVLIFCGLFVIIINYDGVLLLETCSHHIGLHNDKILIAFASQIMIMISQPTKFSLMHSMKLRGVGLLIFNSFTAVKDRACADLSNCSCLSNVAWQFSQWLTHFLSEFIFLFVCFLYRFTEEVAC